MKIKTSHDFPPIPIRSFDWSAYDDNTYDPGEYDYETGRYIGGSPVGHGATEQEAIRDLMEQLEETEQA